MKVFEGKFIEVAHIPVFYAIRILVFETKDGSRLRLFGDFKEVYRVVNELDLKKGDDVRVELDEEKECWSIEKI